MLTTSGTYQWSFVTHIFITVNQVMHRKLLIEIPYNEEMTPSATSE